MQLDDALARFLLQLQADGRSPHTVAQYRRHLRLFGRWSAHVGHGGAIEKTTHEDVARFLTSTQANTRPDGAGKKAGSMNALRASLRGFFRYLHQAGYVAEDPTRLVRRSICGRPLPRALSGRERERLLHVLAGADGWEARRDHALFHLMLQTGIRLGAAVALDVEDVDLDRAEIEVGTAKGNRPSRVFLSQAIRNHLRRYVGDRTGGPLFPGRNGRRLTTRHVRRRLSHWLKKARIRRSASPHSLRHSFALGLYRKTGDILLVKEALGHRSITSTLVYTRAAEEQLRQALA